MADPTETRQPATRGPKRTSFGPHIFFHRQLDAQASLKACIVVFCKRYALLTERSRGP